MSSSKKQRTEHSSVIINNNNSCERADENVGKNVPVVHASLHLPQQISFDNVSGNFFAACQSSVVEVDGRDGHKIRSIVVGDKTGGQQHEEEEQRLSGVALIKNGKALLACDMHAGKLMIVQDLEPASDSAPATNPIAPISTTTTTTVLPGRFDVPYNVVVVAKKCATGPDGSHDDSHEDSQIDEEVILVSESGAGVVTVLDAQGNVLRKIGKHVLRNPSGLAVNTEAGFFIVLDKGDDALHMFSLSSGKHMGRLNGTLHAEMRDALGNSRGTFNSINGIALFRDLLAVGDNDGVVEVFRISQKSETMDIDPAKDDDGNCSFSRRFDIRHDGSLCVPGVSGASSVAFDDKGRLFVHGIYSQQAALFALSPAVVVV